MSVGLFDQFNSVKVVDLFASKIKCLNLNISFYSDSFFNRLSSNTTKWSNTLKQFPDKVSTNRLSAFDHFVKSALNSFKPEAVII